MRLGQFVLATVGRRRESAFTRQKHQPQTRDKRGIPGAHTNYQGGTRKSYSPFFGGLSEPLHTRTYFRW